MKLADLPTTEPEELKGYRLVNSKYPPIHVFDDVSDAEEFEILYALQGLTNPRLSQETGNLHLLPAAERPFGIPGCSYAMAPFTHVNPDGSRFTNGDFGVYYMAESKETAVKEVMHHQSKYWSNVPDLKFERFVYRCLFGETSAVSCRDLTGLPSDHPLYDLNDYSAGQSLGAEIKEAKEAGVTYRSVRREGGICWALFSPRFFTGIIQAGHYEMIWDDKLISVNEVKAVA